MVTPDEETDASVIGGNIPKECVVTGFWLRARGSRFAEMFVASGLLTGVVWSSVRVLSLGEWGEFAEGTCCINADGVLAPLFLPSTKFGLTEPTLVATGAAFLGAGKSDGAEETAAGGRGDVVALCEFSILISTPPTRYGAEAPIELGVISLARGGDSEDAFRALLPCSMPNSVWQMCSC